MLPKKILFLLRAKPCHFFPYINPSPNVFFTVAGNTEPTFHASCTARGLLLHDQAPDDTMLECSTWAGGDPLRSLFVCLLLMDNIDNALNLWNNHKTRYVGRFFLVDQSALMRRGEDYGAMAVIKHPDFLWCGVVYFCTKMIGAIRKIPTFTRIYDTSPPAFRWNSLTNIISSHLAYPMTASTSLSMNTLPLPSLTMQQASKPLLKTFASI